MVTCLSPSPSPYGFTVEPYCVYTRTFMLDSKQSLTMNRNRMPHQKHIIGRELTSRCTYSVYPTIRTGSQAKVCYFQFSARLGFSFGFALRWLSSLSCFLWPLR